MNRTAPSINAVLANERYHAAHSPRGHGHGEAEHEGTPDSPVSPTPSFSWPRRVRSPEPHVPLRKASPERLHQRPKKPPLFITTNHGSQALGPQTASSVASPHSSQVHAATANKNHWWDESGETHPQVRQRQRQRQRQLSAVDHRPSTVRQRQLAAADATRNPSWPLADRKPSFSMPSPITDDMRTSCRSAMTSASSHMDSTIDTTRSSIVTADSSVSDCVKIDSSWADDDDDDDDSKEDGEFTVEDALDMYLGGFGTPSRLSVDLRNSLDVRGSVDARRESYPRGSTDQSSLRPGSSPLRNAADFGHHHRRSRSTGVADRKTIFQDIKTSSPLSQHDRPTSSTSQDARPASPTSQDVKPPPPLTLQIKPPLIHTRTSTDIISGRDSSASHPQGAPVAIPRDRYGFKKISLHITLQQYDQWEKPYNEHLERRRTKWNAMMKQFGYSTENPNRFPAKSEKVKRYVRKGIPPDWRGAAWFWYAGGPGKLAKDPGLYWNLLNQVNQGALSDSDREHIERDLNRTFPDNIRFKPDPVSGSASANDDIETPMIKSLRRVLQAFAVHNPNIGYCQSLNFIAGLLLLFLDEDEEKAFVLLNVVTTQHLPGTHGVALEGANIDIGVLMASIKESLPSIWAKLDDKPTTPGPGGVPRLPTVSLATTAWFMSLFVGTLPIECVLRVWDCLFFEGSKTLFRVALAIFKSGEQEIKAVNDPMEIFQVVQTMPRGMLDANTLMECCFRKRGGFGGLSQDVVERRREEGRNATREGRLLTDETHKKSSLLRGKSRGRFRSKKGVSG